MMLLILLNLTYLIVGVGLLYKGADWLVDGGVATAKKLGVSSLVIGLTLVAFATSLPELLVSLNAAIDGNPDISMGNVVGSNICNIGLILGLSAIINPIVPQKSMMKTDMPFFLFSAIFLTVFYYFTGGVNRWQGALFFAGILFYTWWSIYSARKAGLPENKEEEKSEKSMTNLAAFGWIVLGFASLVIGAKVFVTGSVYFARLLKISDAVIGLTLVAVGTSLPELATSVVASLRKENDIAIGNIVGSNIFNILCILGITPLVCPIHTQNITIVDFAAMLILTGLLVVNLRTGWKLSRKEGALFIFIYIAYTAWLIFNAAC